jgi:hypothetical protein
MLYVFNRIVQDEESVKAEFSRSTVEGFFRRKDVDCGFVKLTESDLSIKYNEATGNIPEHQRSHSIHRYWEPGPKSAHQFVKAYSALTAKKLELGIPLDTSKLGSYE